MAKLSELVGDLPPVDPLPQFATWSAYQGSANCNIYGSNFDLISSNNIGSPTGATSVRLWGGNQTSEFGNSSGIWHTDSTISTSTTNSAYWIGATPWHQADGHMGISIPGRNSRNGAILKSTGNYSTAMRYWGVVIGKEGVRQRVSISQNNSTISISNRGARGHLESINVNSATFATWNGQTSSGMIGYNDRTRTLVALEGDNSNNYRMHIWQNLNENRSLNTDKYDTGTLRAFLAEAKTGGASGVMANYNFYNFTWNQNNSSSYIESRHRMRVVPGDNGIIGLARMVPDNVVHYATFNPSTETLTTSYNTLALTTSYGIEQGNYYGMRHEITWDNKVVAAYAPYYFYGSGLMTYYINTENPTRTFTASNTGSSHGARLLPLGSNKFVYNDSSSNADSSQGIILYVVDIGGYFDNMRNPTGGTLSNNQSVAYTLSAIQRYVFDTRYTSTNYPCILPVDKWMNK